jgi:protein-S-isoprenylcysteine O-methyltransferase Ste14
MRWFVFILLLLGGVFSLKDVGPLAVGQSGISGTILLGVLASPLFLAAVVGLFWRRISLVVWAVLVCLAVVASLALYVAHFSERMVVPILADLTLLLGIVTNRWSAAAVRMRGVQGSVPTKSHPLLRVPVPWVFVLAYLAGLGVQALLPISGYPASIIVIGRVAGAALALIGGLIAFSSLGSFRRAGTSTIPFETPKLFVTWGFYRFCRNPMYLGLTVIYLGVAALYGHLGPVLVLPLIIAYVHRIVIPVEEARLHATFGNEYDQYRARVRRWI